MHQLRYYMIAYIICDLFAFEVIGMSMLNVDIVVEVPNLLEM